MLYHVKTGEVDVHQEADSPREAALAAVQVPNKSLGRIVVVGEHPINSREDEVFFHTRSLLIELDENSPLPNGGFRVIGDDL